MTLYHGCTIDIAKVDLDLSKPNKDFGRAFYLSDDHCTEPHGRTLHDNDIVYGPIADDGVTFQLRRYEGGVISLPKLVEELKYAKGITFQYFFGTERALQQLKRL